MPDLAVPATADALRAEGFADVGAAADVPPLEGRRATVDGRRVAVFRLPDGFAATDAACPHRGGPLSDGIVADDCVTCPLHNWRLNLRTGRVAGQDAAMPLHHVVERDGRLWVRLAGACDGHPAAGAPAARRATAAARA
ncbi:Rieske 2Fe-2S domain-containing protein [Patulibacter sp. SYSU D01012]|uniref:Rieske (2Fe-2S) protein n=1 Tax=Patulibacter sp. SYSU D01012 TaxID=2817381 RepID=UPI001B30E0B7|nr:Rieske 2Fe-2S domain-containing protein [Patulibacter sp. SYSU D01012]